MRVDDFDFELPENLIALEPARPRDSARLLHVQGDHYADKIITDIADVLNPGDLLVVNDTKVLPAQLQGLRKSRTEDGKDITIDVTLHKDISENDAAPQHWKAFMRPAKRVQKGDQLLFADEFIADVLARDGAEAHLSFPYASNAFLQRLRGAGAPPLPPYIARKRGVRDEDKTDYQTRYANEEGSVAAPTAGLHFTENLMDALNTKGVGFETITLHVGAGTFLPVSVDDTDDHIMHSEWGEITPEQAARINKTRANGGRIIAVGTTSLRLLESAADVDGSVRPFCQETGIFITPGYDFKIVDVLMTNFHLPRSTLFMLVCAFAGYDAMKGAYAHAVEAGYRFYSYGDACLLER